MAREKGVVLKFSNGKAQVGIPDEGSFCDSCLARLVCHSTASARMRIVEVPRTKWMKEGQTVILRIPDSLPTLAALILFGIPIVFAILGAMVAYRRFPHSGWAAPLGLALGLLIAAGIIFWINRLGMRHGWFLPRAFPATHFDAMTEGELYDRNKWKGVSA